MQLSNKACLNIKGTASVSAKQPITNVIYLFLFRESGTNSLYRWLPPSLKNLATPAREEHFPPASDLHPQYELGGGRRGAALLQARGGHLTWGKLRSSCDFAEFSVVLSVFILCLRDRWRPLLGFLTPAVITCFYKHPLSVLLKYAHNHNPIYMSYISMDWNWHIPKTNKWQTNWCLGLCVVKQSCWQLTSATLL